jgi:hypothetical protein
MLQVKGKGEAAEAISPASAALASCLIILDFGRSQPRHEVSARVGNTPRTRKSVAKKMLFPGDHGNVNDSESRREQHRQRPTEQGHGKPCGHQHRAQVERIARVRVRTGNGKFAILLHSARRGGAQHEAGQYQHQAPRNGGWMRRTASHLKNINRSSYEAQRHTNAPRQLLPRLHRADLWMRFVGSHPIFSSAISSSAAFNTSSGAMVSKPGSGASRRV